MKVASTSWILIDVIEAILGSTTREFASIDELRTALPAEHLDDLVVLEWDHDALRIQSVWSAAHSRFRASDNDNMKEQR